MIDNENENRKTLADIVADMRKRCTPYAKSDSADCRYVAYLGYKEFADRIEEACKRERAESAPTSEKSSAVGNADPKFDLCRDIEKVLKICRDFQKKAKLLCDTIELLRGCLASKVSNATVMREALTKISESATYALKYRHKGLDYGDLQGFIKEIGEDASAALSSPARNCDIYTTSGDADRAITEYCSKMAETGECVKSCPYRESEGGCAFGWLLAAAGTKGENE